MHCSLSTAATATATATTAVLRAKQNRLLGQLVRRWDAVRCHSSSAPTPPSASSSSASAPPPAAAAAASSSVNTNKNSKSLPTQMAAYKFRKPGDNAASNKSERERHLLLKAGVPFVLFSILAAWVVSNALDGKLKEMETSQGKQSVSIRQAKLQEEHEDMMDRLGKIVATEFDNTKRIQRPEEVLATRRLERQKRNKWYRRAWRAVSGAE